MMETHFPGSKLESSNVGGGKYEDDRGPTRTTFTNSNLPNSIFTRSKVAWAVHSFEPFKSPGLDGIFPALIQHGGKNLLNTFQIFSKQVSLWDTFHKYGVKLE